MHFANDNVRTGSVYCRLFVTSPIFVGLPEAHMTTRLASLGKGVDLAYDVVGTLAHPVVMPLLGITDNITDWADSLCDPFIESGYCVVRHECRDMGWSTQMDGAEYCMEEIVDDVIGLMDYL